MKIAITTVRTLSREGLISYGNYLREIGVPIKTVFELLRSGKAEWTSIDNGLPVTTRYELSEEN